MGDRLVINVPRYKGEYDFDTEEDVFTSLEWRWIKKISGYLPLTINQGLQGGDPDLFVAFAVIALARAGKIRREEALPVADTLAEEPFDGVAIQLVGAEVADGQDPPVEPAKTPETEQQLRSIG